MTNPTAFLPLGYDATAIVERLDRILANQETQETAMSRFSDAILTLNANDLALKDEVAQVVGFIGTIPAKIKAAVDEAITNGADPADLAAINAVSDDLAAEHAALVAALPSTTVSIGNGGAGSTTTTTVATE